MSNMDENTTVGELARDKAKCEQNILRIVEWLQERYPSIRVGSWPVFDRADFGGPVTKIRLEVSLKHEAEKKATVADYHGSMTVEG
jgi:hypothetical protein